RLPHLTRAERDADRDLRRSRSAQAGESQQYEDRDGRSDDSRPGHALIFVGLANSPLSTRAGGGPRRLDFLRGLDLDVDRHLRGGLAPPLELDPLGEELP